jgi:two-component system, OmpR family, sensor histidine kinase KdpD
VTSVFRSSLVPLAGVAAITALTAWLLPRLGLASASLLFLLPVLVSAMRGGVVPGLIATFAGTAAYNFFLLEPRYTFRVHQVDNLVSVFVLGAVAIVTSRLANRLLAREAEANERAEASATAARLATTLSADPPDRALQDGLAFMTASFGEALLIDEQDLAADEAALSSLDRGAASWALHNGDRTGHGTGTMAAAEWTFVPLHPRNRSDQVVLALARPANGSTRGDEQIRQIGDLCLLLGQCRDRARLFEERRERELVEARDRLRQTMLASLAHDFRTPLTVISGQLEQLAVTNEQAQEALRAARRLERTMADLLGLARLEDGSLVVRSESLDPVDVAATALERMTPPAGMALRSEVATDLPFVAGDAVLLQHVLVNLLDNAMWHARSAVLLRVRAVGDIVEFSVEDDGSGIAPGDRDRLFERFTRIEGSDRTEGSGLGLAIVKGFADAMGMQVKIADAEPTGARFSLLARSCNVEIA